VILIGTQQQRLIVLFPFPSLSLDPSAGSWRSEDFGDRRCGPPHWSLRKFPFLASHLLTALVRVSFPTSSLFYFAKCQMDLFPPFVESTRWFLFPLLCFACPPSGFTSLFFLAPLFFTRPPFFHIEGVFLRHDALISLTLFRVLAFPLCYLHRGFPRPYSPIFF